MDKVKVELLLKELSKLASLYKANEFNKVIKNSKKLLKDYPKFSPIYNFLGLSYRQLGKIELAEKILLEGYSKDPKNPGFIRRSVSKKIQKKFQNKAVQTIELVENIKTASIY